MLVPGWGQITNTGDFSTNNFSRFNVSTRTLQKLSLPISNYKCSGQILNFDNQFCADGKLSKYFEPFSVGENWKQ